MKSAIEQRLDRLKEKRDALDAQIKQVETEKAHELRKQRAKKAAVLGMAVLEVIEAGQSVQLASEADLLVLLDERLTRKADRLLFGLTVEAQGKKSVTASKKTALSLTEADVEADNLVTLEQPETSSAKADQRQRSESKRRKKFPLPTNQDVLMAEFNV